MNPLHRTLVSIGNYCGPAFILLAAIAVRLGVPKWVVLVSCGFLVLSSLHALMMSWAEFRDRGPETTWRDR